LDAGGRKTVEWYSIKNNADGVMDHRINERNHGGPDQRAASKTGFITWKSILEDV